MDGFIIDALGLAFIPRAIGSHGRDVSEGVARLDLWLRRSCWLLSGEWHGEHSIGDGGPIGRLLSLSGI